MTRPGARRLVGLIFLSVTTGLMMRSSVAGVGIATLGLIWIALPWGEGPPVMQLALTFQWLQIAIGFYYVLLTGRVLPAATIKVVEPLAQVALVALISLLAGLRLGYRPSRIAHVVPRAFATSEIAVVYALSVVGGMSLNEIAFVFPAFTQALLAIALAHLALLFLLLRRLISPRLQWRSVIVIMTGEVVLGFSSYFAGFKEPLMIAALAFLEIFQPRRVAHWIAAGTLTLVVVLTGVMWLGIRSVYRAEWTATGGFGGSTPARLTRIADLAGRWFGSDADEYMSDVDSFVDRLWAIYYPALAYQRVPSVVPHEDGRIMRDAVESIVKPRFLFPDKPALASDSEEVRKYAGVWVSGEESNVSIAFGYVAEAYVDFGLPWMFVPILLYGVLVGFVCRSFERLIVNRELTLALVTALAWMSLYLFERSWVKTLGLFGTMSIYLGGLTILVDRYFAGRLLRFSAVETSGRRRVA